jgi:ribosome maturation factor RimP
MFDKRGQKVPSFIRKKMIAEEQVQKLINDFFTGSDKFLVELHIKPINVISVFIDSDTNISIEDCRELSRYLEQGLDREKEDFELTVSSAGLDRPLKMLRQYLKMIGKSLDIVLLHGEKLQGKLVRADHFGIEIEQEIKISKKESKVKKIALNYENIRTAKTVITFKK